MYNRVLVYAKAYWNTCDRKFTPTLQRRLIREGWHDAILEFTSRAEVGCQGLTLMRDTTAL